MKKLSLILLIAVLAYSQVGYHIVMRHSQYLQKKEIKKQLRSQLKEEELEVIQLTGNKQIHWLEDGKEFILKGEMYDVVKRQIINGKEILYCINDKKEKVLVDNYNRITKQNSDADKKSKAGIDKSFTLFIDQPELNNTAGLSHNQSMFSLFTSPLSENVIDKISPPPKA